MPAGSQTIQCRQNTAALLMVRPTHNSSPSSWSSCRCTAWRQYDQWEIDMSNEVLIDDEQAAVAEAATFSSKQKRRWLRRRADRKGLGTTEIALIALAIIIVGILAGIGITRARSARDSAEYGVLQANIDQIAQISDVYWGQHAADIDGRRKISLLGFCQYANSQLAAEEINLRTVQFVADDGDDEASADLTQDGLPGGIAVRTAPVVDSTTAGCPFDTADLDDTYADILVTDEAAGTFAQGSPSDVDINGTGTVAAHAAAGQAWAAAIDPDDFSGRLEDAGLLSTRTVWMAMMSDGSQLASGIAATEYVPDGTDTSYVKTGALRFPEAQHGTEVLIFGGQAPDGTSFCLIKVFDASNNDRLGEYRVSREANDDRQFALCTQGVNAADENQPERGGSWPEPR